jgi:hypothetical protein
MAADHINKDQDMPHTTTPPLTKPALVVLAAGMGSRFGGLKQIEPVGAHGEIVLDYAVHDALRAGFGRLVFVIRREIEADFRAVVEPRLAGRVPIDYVFQSIDDLPPPWTVPPGRAKPWGTGHAVRACRDAIRGPFAVINADDIYGPPAFEILAGALAALETAAGEIGSGEVESGTVGNRHVLVAFDLGRTLSPHGGVSRGVCAVDADGKLTGVVERSGIEAHAAGARYPENGGWRTLAADTPVSMNMWGFSPHLFEHLDQAFERFLRESGDDPAAEFQLPTVIDELVRGGTAEVHVLRTTAAWLGVTHPADRAAVAAGLRELVDAGLYPERLWG